MSFEIEALLASLLFSAAIALHCSQTRPYPWTSPHGLCFFALSTFDVMLIILPFIQDNCNLRQIVVPMYPRQNDVGGTH